MEKVYYILYLYEDCCPTDTRYFRKKENALKLAEEWLIEKMPYFDCSPFDTNEEFMQNALKEGYASNIFYLEEAKGSIFEDE